MLSDKHIYKYFNNLMKEKGVEVKEYQEQPFVKINPQNYRAIFHEEKVRDDFNAGLKNLKSSGRFEAIYDKYLREGQSSDRVKK